MCGFARLDYEAKDSSEQRVWIYIALAILVQPLIKISLDRALWAYYQPA